MCHPPNLQVSIRSPLPVEGALNALLDPRDVGKGNNGQEGEGVRHETRDVSGDARPEDVRRVSRLASHAPPARVSRLASHALTPSTTTKKGNEMKLNVNWKQLGKALWAAIKPVLLGAIGGGIVGISTGCSSMTPNNKTQTMGVYALGIPGIAVITQSHQAADATGEDVNANRQTNPVTTELKVK